MIKPVCPCDTSILSSCRSFITMCRQQDNHVLRQTKHLRCWLWTTHSMLIATFKGKLLFLSSSTSSYWQRRCDVSPLFSLSLPIIAASGMFPPRIWVTELWLLLSLDIFIDFSTYNLQACMHKWPSCFNVVLSLPAPHQVALNKWPNKCIQIVL